MQPQCRSRLATNTELVAVAAADCARIIMSKLPSLVRYLRKLSRAMRLIRFRPTAAGMRFLATANPSRAVSNSFSRYKTMKQRSVDRCALPNTWANSAGLVSLKLRLKLNAFLDVATSAANSASMAQTRALLPAPAFQYQTTTLGGHSCAETVGTFALNAAWLICTFHCFLKTILKKSLATLNCLRKPDRKQGDASQKRARKITLASSDCQ